MDEEIISEGVRVDVPAEPEIITPITYPEQHFQGWVAGGMAVDVHAPEGALPEGTRMTVSPVDNNEIAGRVNGAVAGEIVRMLAVDISFYDRSGKEIEPLLPVSVVFTSETFAREPSAPEVIHIDSEGCARQVELSPDLASYDNELGIKADSFSVYAIVYTVDFEYNDLKFSMEGGSSILLSGLFGKLGIMENPAEVKDAVFSDPDLVSVSPLTDDRGRIYDWKLVSLVSFGTSEKLELTFKNGKRIEIKVTDAQYITDLGKMISDASVYDENGSLIASSADPNHPWPAKVRENVYYDLRLEFKENSTFQFIDDATWMTYPLPDGLILDGSFERQFTMSVGDGVKLEGNILSYDNDLRMFLVKWNTESMVALNKLRASNSAQFRMDFRIKFSFNPDEIDFGNDVIGQVIKDESTDVEIKKTGVFDPEHDKADYVVTVTSFGNSKNVAVRDKLFGSALTYISDLPETDHGVKWETNLAGGNSTVGPAQVLYTDKDAYPDREEGLPCGFELQVGEMQDGETLTFTYSASVDYDKLSGAGTSEETFNEVEAQIGNEPPKKARYDFEGNMRYVELAKSRTLNWGDDDVTTVYWKLRVNENPKVSLAGNDVSDRIYAGDLEAMDYSGDGIHVKVYDADGTFLGEYDVPWSELRRTPLEYIEAKDAAMGRLRGLDEDAIQKLLDRELALPEEDRVPYLIDAIRDRSAYQFASWTYTIPQTQRAMNGGDAVVIDNRGHYYYDITYTTLADKTKMVFEGYVGNEAQEHRTGTQKQSGLFPPGVGAIPEVHKYVDQPVADDPRLSGIPEAGSNENYIYWKITFDRQAYNLTRCVIEDNNPSLWGFREPVDLTKEGDSYEWLIIDGLTDRESWTLDSDSSGTRTSIKFYVDNKPGLLASSDSYTGGSGQPSNTITIHLRTKNNPEWIEGTLTRYTPRDHLNTVTWIPNAHEVTAQAVTTPDIRRIEKTGKEVGTIIRDGIELAVFKYELFLSGISAKDFANGNSLVISDVFNTDFLQLVDVSEVARYKNTATGVAVKGTLTPDEQANLGASYWDQGLKGYSKTNRWVGPLKVSIEDYAYSGDDPSRIGEKGLTFTVTEEDFMTPDSKGRNGLDPDSETGEYCLRYSLSYYLMVKDGVKARELATMSEAELEALGIKKEGDKVSFSNVAGWNGVEEKAVAEAGTEFKPVSKSVAYNEETDTAAFRVVLNPQALKLNQGQMIRVEDEYENLAVDFSSVRITTAPEERASQVEWTYHSNKGTFWIPDETMVVISYNAAPIGSPGKSTTFSNTVTMAGFPPENVTRTVTLNSESEGSAGDYNIRLYKYQDNSMNKPLEGAVFQLFEEGDGASGDINVNGKYYKPLRYLADNNRTESRYEAGSGFADYAMLTAAGYPTRENHQAGDFIYFGTTSMGYADIHLRQDEDGLALDRGKQYYLREIHVPAGFAGETVYDSVTGTDVPLFWSFIIDDMDYFDQVNQIFVYRDNGILTVSNTSRDQGIVLRKHFAGDKTLYEDQENIVFEIVGRKKGVEGDEASWDIVYKREILYGEFTKDNVNGGYVYKIRPESLPNDGSSTYVYTITEKNADIPTFTRKTTVTTSVNDGPEAERVHESEEELIQTSVEIQPSQIEDRSAFRFDFTNIYEAQPVTLTFTKQWGTKAAGLHTKRAELILCRDGVPLYVDDNDPLVLKPVPENLPEGAEAPKPTRFTLCTKTPTATVGNLPRYKADGTAYEYSVREVLVSYVKDGKTIVAEGDDLDTQFVILAYAPDGTDGEGNPVYKNVPVSYGEATFDTDHKDGVLTIENEVAELTGIQVNKVWYDENGEEDTSKTDDDAVLFDLYRTTKELPRGGSDRKTYNILPQNDTNGATILTDTLEVKEGDLIDITVTSLAIKGSSSGKPIYIINFGGLIVWTPYVQPFIYEGVTYASRWAYNFDVVAVYDTEGNDVTNEYQILRHQSSAGVRDLAIMYVSSYSKPRQTIIIRVRAEHLDWTRKADPDSLYVRNVSDAKCTVSLENYSQKQENLNREKLEGMVSSEGLKPFRSGIELNRTNSWVYLNNLPKDDGKGNIYTYFAIERQAAGYQDAYEIQSGEDGESTIIISNTPIDATDPANLGTLKVGKQITGLPPLAAHGKEYRFTVQNGFKYLVDTGGGHYELMTRATAEAAGRQVEFVIEEGEANARTFSNILPGTYTIRETRLSEAEAEHYDMEVSYARSGVTTPDFAVVTVLKTRTSDVTIVNTYTPVCTDFSFGKLWITGQDSVPITWPKDEKITVRVKRRSGGNEDASFYIDLELGEDGAQILDSDGGAHSELRKVSAGTPGRYNDYTWTVSGIEEYDESGQPYTYYVRETNESYSYEKLYGTLKGAAAVPEDPDDKTEASDNEFIINRIGQTELSFVKEWYDGREKNLIDHWPQREVEPDPESDAGAESEAAAEYEYVPIDIVIKRKLRYELGGHEVTASDFDPNFSVVFKQLTMTNPADGKTLVRKTDEGNVTLTKQTVDGRFVYSISGLKTAGFQTIKGTETEGAWEYYITERRVDGYRTDYYDSSGVKNDEVSVQNEGVIRNTYIYGRLIITKEAEGLPDSEKDRYFLISVQRKTSGDEAEYANKYLLKNGDLHENRTWYEVQAGDKLYFEEILPGTYQIEEKVDGDDGAGITGYTLEVTNSVSEASPGSVCSVGIESNKVTNVTMTNSYTLKKTAFNFEKLWLPLADSPDALTPVEWPEGETVSIELHRKAPDGGGTGTPSYSEDRSFKLGYSGTMKNGKVEWQYDASSTPAETDIEQVNMIPAGSSGHVYGFSLSGLTKTVLKDSSLGRTHAGEDWVYYITETGTGANYEILYGRSVTASTAADPPSGGSGAPKAEIVDGKDAAGQGEAIINRQDKISVYVYKEWYDYDWKAMINWPKTDDGSDVKLEFTIKGTKEGAAPVRLNFRNVYSAVPEGEKRYRIHRSGRKYVFEFMGLEPGYSYSISEKPGGSYFSEYWTSDTSERPNVRVFNEVPEGGTIRNYYTTYELPHTGGHGKLPFIIAGAVMIAVSGTLLFAERSFLYNQDDRVVRHNSGAGTRR
jgi:hypothetical protein